MEAFLILIILWILYFAIHSVFASKFIKDLFNRYFPALFKYYRIIYVVFALFLLLLIFIYQSTLPQKNFYMPNTLITFIGFMGTRNAPLSSEIIFWQNRKTSSIAPGLIFFIFKIFMKLFNGFYYFCGDSSYYSIRQHILDHDTIWAND